MLPGTETHYRKFPHFKTANGLRLARRSDPSQRSRSILPFRKHSREGKTSVWASWEVYVDIGADSSVRLTSIGIKINTYLLETRFPNTADHDD